jgi:hypothetical protein
MERQASTEIVGTIRRTNGTSVDMSRDDRGESAFAKTRLYNFTLSAQCADTSANIAVIVVVG